jgi:predicted MFS family arabinose efflux permease
VREPGGSSWLPLLASPPWQRYTAASFLVRLSEPMGLLAFQLIGLQLTGKLSDGALLAGIGSLSGFLGPLLGAWYDRGSAKARTQVTGVVATCALAGVACSTWLGGSFGLVVLLVAVQGVCSGGTWAGFRALLAKVVRPEARGHAHYLESLMTEVGFASGPMVVMAADLAWGPSGAVWLMALTQALGVLILSRLPTELADRPSFRSVPATGGSHRPALPPRAFAAMTVAAAAAFGFSMVESSVPARMAEFGTRASLAGVFMSLLACGSVLGGMLFSRLAAGRGRMILRQAMLFLLFSVLNIPAALAATPLIYGLTLPVNSLPLVPINGLCASEVEATVGAGRRGGAFGLLNAAMRLGGGLGVMTNGLLLRAAPASFVPVVASAAFVMTAGILGASRLRRSGRR